MPHDFESTYEKIQAAVDACLKIPEGVPERDAMAVRLEILKIANKQIAAFAILDRTMTGEEIKLLAAVSKLVDDAIKDKRVVEKGPLSDSQALGWLREQMRAPTEIQQIAVSELPEELILKRAREIESRQGAQN